MKLSLKNKAYLAGFLDGDGSIYVSLKKNNSYKYGIQIAPYVVLFQSSKEEKEFRKICSLIGIGRIRKRKDGMLEYVISKRKNILNFISIIEPYVILKKRQVKIVKDILIQKSNVKNKKDFNKLIKLVNSLKKLNYSKKKVSYTDPVETQSQKRLDSLTSVGG